MTSRPEVRRPGPWRFPQPREHYLANGIRLLLFDLPGQHVITAGVSLDLPLASEPRELEGIASLLLHTLDEGTTAHPGTAFAEALEDEGAALSGGVDSAHSWLYLSVPASRLAAALPLLAEAVRTPALDPADIERHKQLRLAELEQTAAHSGHRAEIAFRNVVVNPAQRSSRLVGGSVATVTAIAPEDVERFHADHYHPAVATVVAAGSFVGDPVPLFDAAFGDWTGRDTTPSAPAATAGQRRLQLIDRPGAVQADIRLGGFGIDRRDERWAAFRLAAYAVGGAFLSRLNKVLREERGYTYGVSLAQRTFRTGGYYAVRGSFRTEVVAPAIAESLELLRVASFEPVEIAAAADYFTGVTPLQYATADGVIAEVGALLGVGLEPGHVDTTLEAIRQVTPESALSAYQQLLDPDDLSLVVVGDADALADPLAAAGIAVETFPADTPLI